MPEGKAAGKKSEEKKPDWLSTKTVFQALGIPLLLVILTQVFTTLLPIWLGTTDLSDFSVSIDPPGKNFNVYDKSISINITVDDLHQTIAPYRHTVYLYVKMPNRTKNLNSDLQYIGSGKCRDPPYKAKLILWPIANNRTKIDDPIEIIGLGGDNKKRSCMFILDMVENTSTNANLPKP